VLILFNYDKSFIAKRASEMGFIRDVLEKFYRLADVLEYLNNNPLLKTSLALKGGTAINLTIFNLPRLSVDIDLDYLKPVSREEMLAQREIINADIFKYMQARGYNLSPKTKNPHSLDSWVFEYVNAGGNRDNMKIEINYSMRAHILPVEERAIVAAQFTGDYKVNSLSAIEIFASKINALLNRAAARDLYDINNMLYFGLFDESEYSLLRKCILFYCSISSKTLDKGFDASVIDKLTNYKIRTELLPVIRRKEHFNLDSAKAKVKKFIAELMVLTPQEQEFIFCFENKRYMPELLFDDEAIVGRIKEHPMILWKMRN
jgi:predicted nucleotidyltransferase component of viral defense system